MNNATIELKKATLLLQEVIKFNHTTKSSVEQLKTKHKGVTSYTGAVEVAMTSDALMMEVIKAQQVAIESLIKEIDMMKAQFVRK